MNNRGERINAEMQRALQLIVGQLKDPRISGLISITKCEVTKDLKHAKVYVSVMASEQERKLTIDALTSGKSFVRKQLASEIDLRIMPELHFVIDESMDNSFRINAILAELKKKDDNNN